MDPVKSEMHVHCGSAQVKVSTSGQVHWLTVPVSADGTARITVFLEVDDCLRLGQELQRIGEKGMRVQEAMKEPDAAPVEVQLVEKE